LKNLEARIWGFDARITGTAHRRHADELRQQAESVGAHFLLYPETPLPLSVDTAIWPSVFDGAIQDPDYFDDLWSDWALMREHCGAGARPIAVEIYLPPNADVDQVPSNRLFLECRPSTVPPGYTLLGYDIANLAPLSGLCNCGYSEEELATLGPVWRDRLNEHGLLRDFSSALEFLALTEARTGDHGPFFLFALYAEPEA
jgi:hypothetical protein